MTSLRSPRHPGIPGFPGAAILGSCFLVACHATSGITGPAEPYPERFFAFTESGEPYSPADYTAALGAVPLGSYVRVKNLLTGRQTVVKVNDRLPHGSGAVIRLSHAAFRDLGGEQTGRPEVQITFFTPEAGQAIPISEATPLPPLVAEVEAVPAAPGGLPSARAATPQPPLIPVSGSSQIIAESEPATGAQQREAREADPGFHTAPRLQLPPASAIPATRESAVPSPSSLLTAPPVAVDCPPSPGAEPQTAWRPAPAAAVKPAFVIRFGTRLRLEQALADQNELARAGVETRILPIRGAFCVEYRIASMPFASQSEAKRCLAQVKKKSKGFRDATIGVEP